MELVLFTSAESRVELCQSDFLGDQFEGSIALSVHRSWLSTDDQLVDIVDGNISEFTIIFYSNTFNNFYTTDKFNLCIFPEYVRFCNEHKFFCLIIGLCADGHMAVWLACDTESKLLYFNTCKIIPKVTQNVLDTLELNRYISGYNPTENSNSTYNNSSSLTIQALMKQYDYRLCLDFITDKKSDDCPQLQVVAVKNYDGTFDKTNNGALMTYHITGKPWKLSFQWEWSKTVYSAYFWMDEEEITKVFERFYGAHPETKTDFIIRIDAENKKYELALYRQGLKEPVVIPESAYQLIVFKNKFEDYRSENYNQPRGAWIW